MRKKYWPNASFCLLKHLIKEFTRAISLGCSGGLGSGVVHARCGLLPAQRQRSDLAGGALLAEDAVGQIQGPLMRDDEVDGRHQRQALLVVTVGHRDLGVVGATDVDRVDLNAFVVAVAVLPVDRIDDLLGAEALHGPAIDHQVEALATTAAARGLAGGDLGLVLLLHGCLLDVGTCETRRIPSARSRSCLTVDNCKVYRISQILSREVAPLTYPKKSRSFSNRAFHAAALTKRKRPVAETKRPMCSS